MSKSKRKTSCNHHSLLFVIKVIPFPCYLLALNSLLIVIHVVVMYHVLLQMVSSLPIEVVTLWKVFCCRLHYSLINFYPTIFHKKMFHQGVLYALGGRDGDGDTRSIILEGA